MGKFRQIEAFQQIDILPDGLPFYRSNLMSSFKTGHKINNQAINFSVKGETTKDYLIEDIASSFMHTKWQPTGSHAAWSAKPRNLH